MKRNLIILAFLFSTLLSSGQVKTGLGLFNGGIWLFQGGLVSYYDWPEAMTISYLDINNLNTYTSTQVALIKERLSEPYIVNTFGPNGQNKTVCDFFLFFENSNTTTPLTTRVNIKTGELLRWNYGGGVYSQNDLPSQINNGVITITSEDGFSNWTDANITSNTFINNIPSLQYFTGLQDIKLYTNANLDGYLETNSSIIDYVNISSTNVLGDLDQFASTTSLTYININAVAWTGNIGSLANCQSLTQIFIRETSVEGWVDTLTSIPNITNLWINNNNMLYGFRGDTIPTGWNNATMNIFSLTWGTPSIDRFIAECDTSFSTTSGTIDMYNMGQVRTSAITPNINSLISKGITFTANTLTFFNDSLNIAYTDGDTKTTIGLETYVAENNETIHPSILTLNPQLSGYTYWLGITPFTDGDILYENPSIFASNNIDTFNTVTTNPIEPTGLPTYYNSDPDIIYTSDDSLYCIWRPSIGAIKIKSSKDGIIWGDSHELFSPTLNETYIISPSIIEKQDTFFIYYAANVSVATQTIKRRYSTTGIYGEYSVIDSIPAIPEETGNMWWHLDVNYISGKWYMILHEGAEFTGGVATKIFMAESGDGLNFTRDDMPLMNNSKGFEGITNGNYDFYRPSFSAYEDHYILYFSVYNRITARWSLGNTKMYFIE